MLNVIGNKAQKLVWPDHGFYLEVPDEALPPDETAKVTVTIILDDQFGLLANSQLISGLFSITSTRVFHKDVAVNIQHSAVIGSGKEHAKFKFIIANESQPNISQPYRFKEKEGTFNPDSQYGTIMLKQLNSVIGLTAPPTTALYCTSFVFYNPIPNTDKVEFHFVVIRNLDCLAKVHVRTPSMNLHVYSHAVDVQQAVQKTTRISVL